MKENCDSNQCEAQMEMPKYKCHKVVHALKIRQVYHDVERAKQDNSETDGSALLTPEDTTFAPFRVNSDYVRKHIPHDKPFVSGYYVVYEDGYKSFSPAEAFESGYTRI